MWRSNSVHALLLTALIALTGGLRLLDPAWVEGLRVAGFDLYQRLWPKPPVAEQRVVIVDVDAASLARHGQWPWPRSLLARLLSACADAGAVAVAFDIVFGEIDRTSPPVLAADTDLPLDVRTVLAGLPAHDTLLAAAMARIPTVLAWTATAAPTRYDAPSSVSAVLGDSANLVLPAFPGVSGNLPELEEAAAGRGLISLIAEPDGLVRRIPGFSRVGDRLWPSLGLELLRVGVGGSGFVLAAGPAGLEGALLQTAAETLTLPVTGDGRIWVNFAVSAGAPSRYVSAADVLAGAAADRLTGRLVLVGSSFAGLSDLVSTPLRPNVPGVEIHALVVESLLSGQVPGRPGWALAAELSAMLFAILLAALAAGRGSVGVALGVTAGLWTALWGAAMGLYLHRLWLLDATFATLASALTAAVWLLRGYARSAAERRWIRQAFAQYLPPAVVSELSHHPERLQLRGELRELTVMFCDVRGFTTLSEGLPPQALGELMNRFLTGLTAEILAYGGTIDKYIGDSVMAFWNAPLSDPDHACRACHAALALRERLVSLNAELKADGLLPPERALAIGIGLHTGMAAVGNFGSAQRFAYTALGDTVNLASRLEGLCKTLAVDIVVSDATLAQAPSVIAQPLGEVQVRGRSLPVMVYTLKG